MRYGIDRPIAPGYSNGPNIAAPLMLLRPSALGFLSLIEGVLLADLTPLSYALPRCSQCDFRGRWGLRMSAGADRQLPHIVE